MGLDWHPQICPCIREPSFFDVIGTWYRISAFKVSLYGKSMKKPCDSGTRRETAYLVIEASPASKQQLALDALSTSIGCN
jgi:hypothetical protein